MVYLQNEIVFGNKKEWSTNTCYNTDEACQHDANWKKSVTKTTFCTIPFYEMSRIGKSIETASSGCPGLGMRSETRQGQLMGHMVFLLGVMKMFSN